MFLWCTMAFASAGPAQTPESRSDPGSASPRSKKPPAGDDQSHKASVAPGLLLRNLVDDQKNIWSSPFKARIEDLNWLAPAVGLTAGLINADSELSSRISTTRPFTKPPGTASNPWLPPTVPRPRTLLL